MKNMKLNYISNYLCHKYGNLRDDLDYTVNEQLMEVSSSYDFVGRLPTISSI